MRLRLLPAALEQKLLHSVVPVAVHTELPMPSGGGGVPRRCCDHRDPLGDAASGQSGSSRSSTSWAVLGDVCILRSAVGGSVAAPRQEL